MKIVRLQDGAGRSYPRCTTTELVMHEEWLAMLSLAALGSLEAEEQRSVDRHLASGCDRCPGALRTYMRVAAALGLASPSIRPSALGTRRVKRMVRRASAGRV